MRVFFEADNVVRFCVFALPTRSCRYSYLLDTPLFEHLKLHPFCLYHEVKSVPLISPLLRVGIPLV